MSPVLLMGGGSGSIVSLADMKTHLQIGSTATYDAQLQGYIDAATVIVEEIGDIALSRSVAETYDGGGTTIVLLQTPIISISSVIEYVGTIAYTLTQTANPSLATGPYCYQVDLASGLLVRLATGVVSRFPAGRRNVFASYTAGQALPPANAVLALKELVAHWWRWGQQGNRPEFTDGAVDDMSMVSSSGYAIPNRVVELLRPLPGIA